MFQNFVNPCIVKMESDNYKKYCEMSDDCQDELDFVLHGVKYHLIMLEIFQEQIVSIEI